MLGNKVTKKKTEMIQWNVSGNWYVSIYLYDKNMLFSHHLLCTSTYVDIWKRNTSINAHKRIIEQWHTIHIAFIRWVDSFGTFLNLFSIVCQFTFSIKIRKLFVNVSRVFSIHLFHKQRKNNKLYSIWHERITNNNESYCTYI